MCWLGGDLVLLHLSRIPHTNLGKFFFWSNHLRQFLSQTQCPTCGPTEHSIACATALHLRIWVSRQILLPAWVLPMMIISPASNSVKEITPTRISMLCLKLRVLILIKFLNVKISIFMSWVDAQNTLALQNQHYNLNLTIN